MYIFVILYRRELDIAGYTGNQGQMVTPEECKKVFIEPISEKLFTPQLLPHLNISDLLGGIYSATDGSVDPTGLTTAYARGESIEMESSDGFSLDQERCWEGPKFWKAAQSPECLLRMER